MYAIRSYYASKGLTNGVAAASITHAAGTITLRNGARVTADTIDATPVSGVDRPPPSRGGRGWFTGLVLVSASYNFV